MMGYLTLMLMGVMGYLSMPAAGPAVFYSDHYTRDLSGHAMSRGVEYIIRNGHVAYDCFPSLHVGIPLLLCFYVREYLPKLFLPVCLYVLVMCVAVIYLRYHYLADVVAAFAFAPVSYWLNDWLLAHWPGERIVALPKSVEKSALPVPVEPV
jgi:membrane-associated phospholipid phosphatase